MRCISREFSPFRVWSNRRQALMKSAPFSPWGAFIAVGVQGFDCLVEWAENLSSIFFSFHFFDAGQKIIMGKKCFRVKSVWRSSMVKVELKCGHLSIGTGGLLFYFFFLFSCLRVTSWKDYRCSGRAFRNLGHCYLLPSWRTLPLPFVLLVFFLPFVFRFLGGWVGNLKPWTTHSTCCVCVSSTPALPDRVLRRNERSPTPSPSASSISTPRAPYERHKQMVKI